MVDPVSRAVDAVIGGVKTLVIDKIQDYVNFVNSYDGNMNALLNELKELHAKKERVDHEVTEGKGRSRVMTRQTVNWLESFINLIEKKEMKMLMKEERVAENVVKVMEYSVLKKLWKEDKEIFGILVDVVKKKCNQHQETSDGEVVAGLDAAGLDAADYRKVAKIANNVMKEISEEFTKFIIKDDAAVAVVKLLNDDDLKRLTQDGDEMAKILGKAEGVIRNKVGHNDNDEEHDDEEVQIVDTSIVLEKVDIWRKHIGSLMDFLDDVKFKKGLPKGAILGFQVMKALISNIKSELVEENGTPNSYCGCCFISFEDYRYKHDMSERAAIMVKAINSMIDKCPSGPLTRAKRADELELIPGDFVAGLESREELLQKIVRALKDNSVRMVGVLGMGGSGKTTLVKEVANKRASDLFDKRVVVKVSEAPNIKGIQDQIAEGINFSFEDVQSVAQRARNLYSRLKTEKILIILDNIWNELKLEEVGIPRESTKDFYCKLMITTRERRVCRDMSIQNDNIFEVGMLNEKEALNLFLNQTGKKANIEKFKPVIDRLLRKCGGLPLAIVATASAIRDRNLPMWKEFVATLEKPISSQVSSEYRKIYSIIETSYKLMHINEKKMFFFLACLSPFDSAILVEDLMRFGMGFDLFQHVNRLSEAMEQASAWANELISSSLLLKDDSNMQVKIHDIVRASTISFADKDRGGMTLIESIPRWMCRETFENFTAISLLSGHDFSRLSGVKAPKLEILLLKGDLSSTTFSSNFFEGMTNLKVLSLSHVNFISGLPESMGALEGLKTLHLHHCKLKDIKLIGKLVNLLVLSLRGSSLEELLAFEIGELCHLRLLDMGECKGVKSIPANILSRLSHLEGLYMLNGFDDWASTNMECNDGDAYSKASGSELNALSHLNVLQMEVMTAEQLLTVNNHQLVKQLGMFHIRVGDSHRWEMANVSAFRYIVELDNIDESQNSWLRALLKRTDCLLVMHCSTLTENFVPQLDEDGFKDLKYLDVERSTVKYIINSNEHDASMAFMNLELLRLETLKSLEMICNGIAPPGIFSNVRRLTLSNLPNLKCGLPLTHVPLKLSEVRIVRCYSLNFIVIKNASEAEDERDFVPFPLLKSLYLRRVDSLSRVLGQHNDMCTLDNRPADHTFFTAKSIYPSLESLDLWGNHTIVTLWSPACNGTSFKNLKTLNLFGCKGLQSLGSPSIFAALLQLEKLSIVECAELQEVITKETEEQRVCEHVIVFPLLKHLTLRFLHKLERFYGGSYELEFPKLKSLTLTYASKFSSFHGSQNSTTLFSDKMKFPCLEKLKIWQVSSQVMKLWNWSSSSAAQGESTGNCDSLDPVPNLKKLSIGHIHGLTVIPHFISHKLSKLEFTGFNDIDTILSNLAVNREVLCTYSQLLILGHLVVGNCNSLEQLFTNEEDEDVAILCGRLTKVQVMYTPKLKMLPLHLFKNIHTFQVDHLSWKYLFPADLFIEGREQLQQLERLVIDGCKNMEVIIMDELVGDGERRVYSFPRLKDLRLSYLKITNFASEPTCTLQFPLLEKIRMIGCYTTQSLFSGPFTAPKLRSVVIDSCKDLQFCLSGNECDVRELSSLESVNLHRCNMMLSFSSGPLVAPKLFDVSLVHCHEMKWFIAGEVDILELPSLESVVIDGCKAMASFSPGGIKAPQLREVRIASKNYSHYTNKELVDLLGITGYLHKCHNYKSSFEDEHMNDEISSESSEGSEYAEDMIRMLYE